MSPAAPTDPEDITVWKDGLDAAGLSTIKILIDPIPPAELNAADTTPATVTARKNRVNAWLGFIANQTDCFLIPVMHVQRLFLKKLIAGFTIAGVATPGKTLGLDKKKFDTVASIDAIKDLELLTGLVNEYISELHIHYDELLPILTRLCMQSYAFLNMGGGIDLARVVPTSKFEMMFRNGLNEYEKKQNFIGLMVSPYRITNVLVDRIIDTLLFYLHNKAELIKDIKLVKNTSGPEVYTELATLRSRIYDNRRVLKRSMINKKVLDCLSVSVLKTNYDTIGTFGGNAGYDGWVVGAKPVKFVGPTTAAYDSYTVEMFWFDFLTKMAEQLQPTNTFTTTSIVPSDSDDSKYGLVAAKILIAKLNGQQFRDLYANPLPAVSPWVMTPTFDELPNGIYHTVEYKPGETLENIYKTVDHSISARFTLHVFGKLQ